MKHAINELYSALQIAEKNEPIWRQDGNLKQADLCAARITDLRNGIRVLEDVESTEQHRSDMARTNHEEHVQAFVDSAQKLGANLDAERVRHAKEHLDMVLGVGPGGIEDDLGELDPSAACDLSKEGGCESCS